MNVRMFHIKVSNRDWGGGGLGLNHKPWRRILDSVHSEEVQMKRVLMDRVRFISDSLAVLEGYNEQMSEESSSPCFSPTL